MLESLPKSAFSSSRRDMLGEILQSCREDGCSNLEKDSFLKKEFLPT